jgi:uncharacterized protein YhbP (UPF0306 family)
VREPARERALAYLREHNVMTLATAGPRGAWAAAVFYASEGFELVFLSSPATRHGTDIGAEAQVSAAIHEDYRSWPEIKGVQLEGRAARLEGALRDAALECYAGKFPFVRGQPGTAPEILRALERVAWYRLVPSRLYLIDNSLGFGRREEILPGGGREEE